jgi:predicted anti-sigma-YlaC factor YlaD
MKTCDEFQAKLSAYLDGEASDQEDPIRTHLEACDLCRRILDRLRLVSRRVRDVAQEQPVTLLESIRSRLPGHGPRPNRTRIPRLTVAALSVAAPLWALLLLGDGGDQVPSLSDLAGGGSLSETEQRILYGEPPTRDEWMAIVLSGGSPR